MDVRNAMDMMDKYFGEELKIPVTNTFSAIGWKTPRKNFFILYDDADSQFELVQLDNGKFIKMGVKAPYNLVLAFVMLAVKKLTDMVDE